MNTAHAYELGYAAGLADDTSHAPFTGDMYAHAWDDGYTAGEYERRRQEDQPPPRD